jgi:hypothetical protein
LGPAAPTTFVPSQAYDAPVIGPVRILDSAASNVLDAVSLQAAAGIGRVPSLLFSAKDDIECFMSSVRS